MVQRRESDGTFGGSDNPNSKYEGRDIRARDVFEAIRIFSQDKEVSVKAKVKADVDVSGIVDVYHTDADWKLEDVLVKVAIATLAFVGACYLLVRM